MIETSTVSAAMLKTRSASGAAEPSTNAEQNDYEREDGEALDEARPGIELEHLEPALSQREARHDECRGQREERAACDPGGERAEHEQHPEDRERRLQELDPCGKRRHERSVARRDGRDWLR
jgi:hypothetical protein